MQNLWSLATKPQRRKWDRQEVKESLLKLLRGNLSSTCNKYTCTSTVVHVQHMYTAIHGTLQVHVQVHACGKYYYAAIIA